MNTKEKFANSITKAINEGCRELLLIELVEAVTKDWRKEDIEWFVEELNFKINNMNAKAK